MNDAHVRRRHAARGSGPVTASRSAIADAHALSDRHHACAPRSARCGQVAGIEVGEGEVEPEAATGHGRPAVAMRIRSAAVCSAASWRSASWCACSSSSRRCGGVAPDQRIAEPVDTTFIRQIRQPADYRFEAIKPPSWSACSGTTSRPNKQAKEFHHAQASRPRHHLHGRRPRRRRRHRRQRRRRQRQSASSPSRPFSYSDRTTKQRARPPTSDKDDVVETTCWTDGQFIGRAATPGCKVRQNVHRRVRAPRPRSTRPLVLGHRIDGRRGAPAIESRYLSEVWPGIAHVHADTSMGIGHWWELPYGERAVVDAIVRFVQPDVSFEFGTFSGSTTSVIAGAAPPTPSSTPSTSPRSWSTSRTASWA